MESARLQVLRNLPPDTLYVHPGCQAQWRTLRLMNRTHEKKLLSVSMGTVDPECAARDTLILEKATQGDGQDYGLSLYGMAGSGSTRIKRSGRLVSLGASSYMVVNPTETAFFDPVRGYKGFLVSFSQPLLHAYRDLAGIPKSAGPFDFEEGVTKLRGGLKTAVNQLADWINYSAKGGARWMPTALYGLSMQMLGMLWASHPSQLRIRLGREGYGDGVDPRLHKALDHLRANLHQSVPVAAAARAGGLSRATFFRLCQAQLGKSPEQWLRECRFDQAERLLALSSDHPHMDDIASQVGFSSSSALRRALKAKGRSLRR